jgi:hypothetical protein
MRDVAHTLPQMFALASSRCSGALFLKQQYPPYMYIALWAMLVEGRLVQPGTRVGIRKRLEKQNRVYSIVDGSRLEAGPGAAGQANSAASLSNVQGNL